MDEVQVFKRDQELSMDLFVAEANEDIPAMTRLLAAIIDHRRAHREYFTVDLPVCLPCAKSAGLLADCKRKISAMTARLQRLVCCTEDFTNETDQRKLLWKGFAVETIAGDLRTDLAALEAKTKALLDLRDPRPARDHSEAA